MALLVGASLSLYYGVKVTAGLSGQVGNRCPVESPIQISVANYTFHRVARVTVKLEGWRGGDSRNILDGKGYSFTTVVEPFRSRMGCYSDAAFGALKRFPGLNVGAIVDSVNQYERLAEGVELVVVDYKVTFL